MLIGGLPWWFTGKESTCQCRRHGFNPWLGRSPGGGNGNFNILAWRIPWTEEPAGYSPQGRERIRHNLATKQQQMLTDGHVYDFNWVKSPNKGREV